MALQQQPSSDLLSDLPYDTQLAVMAFLGAADLCRAQRACRVWWAAANDNATWRRLLRREMHGWPVVSHLTQPGHQEAFSSAKATYLRCSPAVAAAAAAAAAGAGTKQGSPAPLGSLTSRLMRRLQALSPPSALSLGGSRQPRRIVMCGPGIVTVASDLPRLLFWGRQSPFRIGRMFPGVGGYGGGVQLQLGNQLNLNLICLYPNTKHEREQNRNAASRLTDPNGELARHARALCATVDAFVFVADSQATRSPDDAARDRAQLSALLDPRWTKRSAPLLVFGCSRTPASQHTSCVDLCRDLHVGALARPWAARSLPVGAFAPPLVAGMQWLDAQLS